MQSICRKQNTSVTRVGLQLRAMQKGLNATKKKVNFTLRCDGDLTMGMTATATVPTRLSQLLFFYFFVNAKSTLLTSAKYDKKDRRWCVCVFDDTE